MTKLEVWLKEQRYVDEQEKSERIIETLKTALEFYASTKCMTVPMLEPMKLEARPLNDVPDYLIQMTAQVITGIANEALAIDPETLL